MLIENHVSWGLKCQCMLNLSLADNVYETYYINFCEYLIIKPYPDEYSNVTFLL